VSRIFQALERAERERTVHKQRREEEQTTRVLDEPGVRRLSASLLEQPAEPQRRRDAEFDQPPAAETLGSIDSHLVSLLAPTALEAEQYRTICHSLEQLTRETGLSVLAVSSPAVGDGKTTTAINLAGTLCQSPGTRVLLVDLDLRRPSLARLFGLNASHAPDVVGVISDPNLSLKNAVRRCSTFNLDVILARQSSAAPHEILKSQRLGELLQETRHCYEYVIIDMPPLVPFSDCQILQRWIDGFLLVVAAHKTPRKLVEEAIQIVEPTKMLGLVFNNDAHPARKYYSYYSHGPSPGDERVGWLHWAAKKLGSSFRRSSQYKTAKEGLV
jgi:capsular exopolysaccharide synthesis family protein